MPHYDYTCHRCAGRREIWRTMAEATKPAHCESCGDQMSRVWDGEAVSQTYDLRPSWSDGHTIFQLPSNCPDRVVTSQTQYDRTCQKYGIDHQTGAPIPGKEGLSAATAFSPKKKGK